jgi:hypothetical protein
MRTRSRPATLPGLLLYAASLRRKSIAVALGAVSLSLLALIRGGGCFAAKPRLATFNIENYPRSEAQEEGAFEAIRDLDSSLIAVQEITDPAGFCGAAKRRLGPSWDCAFTDRPLQRIGVVYDRDALRLLSTAIHRETEVYDGAKPTFEARLQPAGGGGALRVYAVHLKAGGDGAPVRARQLRALAPVVAAAKGSGDDIAIMGDFNATGKEDVENIAAFARPLGLRFASEEVECTAYWNRRDGCLGVALDHVLTSFGARVHAEGPCRTEGCEMRPSCPAFHGKVSDHCPVAVDF